MNSKQLEPNTVIKTVLGEWVQVVSQNGDIVTADFVGDFKGRERRQEIHISAFLLHTAHKLSKKLNS